MSSKSLVQRLASFSSCEVADALIKLKLPHGGLTGQMVLQSDTNAPKPEKHFVDAAERDAVVLISTPSSTRSAVWGGLMTARAQSLGVKGVVVDGRCRDLNEHRTSDFPVFARGHSILGQSPFTRPSELQVPLEISDPTGDGSFPSVTVNPGDMLLADVDGVVSVPKDLITEVIELAQKGRDVDERCMEDLRKGKGIKETFALHRGK
ncbi:hypothetical protein MPSI1_000048 [Malassezia psittaci]|uniref:RraA-like protein n=1 Tax=Malassezia psittaci TaxID=1821823 RepID=A0AAF0F241_9BASI|nr:hypothetical protein MPSI1_000048 [Malassezia psittaci]